MLHLSALKAATTLRQFAALLKFKPAWLTYLLYVQPEASKYKKFDIPKRSGGTRQICATQGDLKLLQGDWITKDEGGNESKWTFKGDKVVLKAQPGDREYTMTIKLDDKAKPDKTLDFAVSDDSKNAKGFKSPGIYKFDGDKKATFCFSADGKTRPTEYKTDLPVSVSVELVKK